MHINAYPAKIEQFQSSLLKLAQSIRTARQVLQNLDRHIDYAIATDASLKNDLQRKAVRSELQSEDAYQSAMTDLQDLQDAQTELEIGLERARSEFTLLKLEKREAIAQLELQAA